MSTETIIETKTVGSVTAGGTVWPVERTLSRVQYPWKKRPEWQIVSTCNGLGNLFGVYPTLRQARERF